MKPLAERPPLIGALLRMPVDALRRRMLDDLHAAGFVDLVPAHFDVMLRYPGPDGRRPSDVAAEVGMSKQAVNYLLGQLEQLGYLVREDDPDDKRSRRIRVTERGHALVAVIRRTMNDIEAQLAHDIGDEEFAQLKHLLQAVNRSTLVTDFRERSGQRTAPAGRPDSAR